MSHFFYGFGDELCKCSAKIDAIEEDDKIPVKGGLLGALAGSLIAPKAALPAALAGIGLGAAYKHYKGKNKKG